MLEFEHHELNGKYFYKDDVAEGKINSVLINLEGEYLVNHINNGNRETLRFNEEAIRNLYYNNIKRDRRAQIIKNKNINNLVHFTKEENLESILEYGILSVNALNLIGTNFKNSDDKRLDGNLDYICNSIEFPNYKMFFSKRMQDKNQKWIIIKINSELILDKLNTLFIPDNSSRKKFSSSIYNLSSNKALMDLFSEENRYPSLPSNYTTNPQAEVLIKDHINHNYIDSIITEKKEDRVAAIARNANVDYDYNTNLFNYRKDYQKWQPDQSTSHRLF